ncbi:hypothetical protein AVT69_gp365 [Pseudomonas phage PhiPA3]|uniref:Uncharacterized protein 371 n=1 Tax=Pseudomonas phage PhiPA3 TaxID=998086 RepID=F8SJK3_BPPA3|nr:hypothetical protein AVT69_gp365 [Pseudomonas phage PhiPA3]AEH03794.1 hypothetical protein [Pseudomonas phage PhiPA3]
MKSAEYHPIPKLSVRNITELTPEEKEANRIRNRQLLEQWRKAHEDLVKYCEEKGIEVPVLVCQGTQRVEALLNTV